MLVKQFPYNPLIISMEYNSINKELKINFRSTSESRTYAEVPIDIFYGIYYKERIGEMLSYYSKTIRKKFPLITKTPIK